jgi:hypothetical protein
MRSYLSYGGGWSCTSKVESVLSTSLHSAAAFRGIQNGLATILLLLPHI